MERYDYFEDIHSGYEPAPIPSGKRPKRGGGLKRAAAVCLAAAVAGASFGLGAKLGTDSATAQTEIAIAGLEQQYSQALDEIQTASEKAVEDTAANMLKTSSSVISSSTGYTASDIFNQVEHSVVSIVNTVQTVIFNRVAESTGAGSGIIFDEDDDKIYIVTNYHVIDSSSAVSISLDDEIYISASYVGGEETYDLAVISVNKSALAKEGITYEIASFGNSDDVVVGDTAVAVGNALGEGKSATLGIISSTNNDYEVSTGVTINVLRTDAAINSGNSGGALVNASGEVIGINTAKLASSSIEGMGYAIPSNTVVDTITKIMESGTVETPYLGISGETITERIRQYYGFSSLGVYVNKIYQDTTASVISLKTGDIITSLNGAAIENIDELSEAVLGTTVGDTFTLGIIRNGQSVTLTGVMQKYNGGTNF